MIERLAIVLAVAATAALAYLLLRRWHQARATLAIQPNGRSTVFYFWSDTCAPCATQSRILDQLVGQMDGRIMVEKINAEHDQPAADRFGIFTVPTTLIVNAAGQVRHANYGFADSAKLAAQLRDVEQ